MYKIVTKRNGKLYSPTLAWDSRWMVEYKPGEWTVPVLPNSGLFFFKSYLQAVEVVEMWKEDYGPLEVWECEVSEVMGLGGMLLLNSDTFMQHFWDTFKEPPENVWRNLAAKQLKLTKEVTR